MNIQTQKGDGELGRVHSVRFIDPMGERHMSVCGTPLLVRHPKPDIVTEDEVDCQRCLKSIARDLNHPRRSFGR